MLDYIANSAIHLGWAIMGHGCDCKGIGKFNRLARFFQRFDDVVWEDESVEVLAEWAENSIPEEVISLEYEEGVEIRVVSHRFHAARYPVSLFFNRIAVWMDEKFDSVEL
jgi:hypothetical protein